MCSGDSKYLPDTFREVVDPHHFRTNSKAEERHKAWNVHQGVPEAPPPPPPPQYARSPDTAQLTRRNRGAGPGLAVPGGGVPTSTLNLGNTLLGGG